MPVALSSRVTAAPAPAAMRAASPTRTDWAWMAAIVGIAIVLRAIGLNAGLWLDEIETLVFYTRRPAAELVTVYPSLNHHVLFTLEAKGAIALFGESAWALRLPAFAFGVASILMLWLVAREVVSTWEARLCALLVAVSYHHVWFSQNARGYTGLLFFGLLSTYLLLRTQTRSSWRTWTGFGVASALAIYTHLSAAMFVAAQFVVYAWVFTRRGREVARGESFTKPLYGFALALVLALLLHAPLLGQMLATFTEVTGPRSAIEAASTAEWKSAHWMILEVARSLGPTGIALPIIIAVVAAGMLGLRQRAPLLPAIVVVHIPLTLAVLAIASMRIWPRYFFIDIGLLCLFVVHGTFILARVATDFAKRRFAVRVDAFRLGVVAVALGIAASLALLPRNYLYPKQDFVGARDFVEQSRSPGSRVLVLGIAAMPYAEYYAPRWQAVESVAEIEAAQRQGQVWVVYAFPGVTERRYRDVVDHVAAASELAKRFPGTLGGGDVLVYRLRTS